MLNKNLADHFSFAGADISPCRCHGQAEGATATYLMVGDDSAALRVGTLKPALIRAFRSGAPNSTQTISDDETRPCRAEPTVLLQAPRLWKILPNVKQAKHTPLGVRSPHPAPLN